MIQITELHKKFNIGTINETYALRGINLNIKQSEFVTIIGTNGSGKSTLLNAVAGTFMPDKGQIYIDGHDVTNKKDFQRSIYIARVFQNPFMGTAPVMSVIAQPKVLLLDEHTAALDPKSATQIIKLTRHFIEQDRLTTIMVTHSMQQAIDMGDRTLMMHKGQIIDDISREEKRQLTVNDLLDKFADLRKTERLTEDVLAALRREYA